MRQFPIKSVWLGYQRNAEMKGNKLESVLFFVERLLFRDPSEMRKKPRVDSSVAKHQNKFLYLNQQSLLCNLIFSTKRFRPFVKGKLVP